MINREELQEAVDILTGEFPHVGLHLDNKKVGAILELLSLASQVLSGELVEKIEVVKQSISVSKEEFVGLVIHEKQYLKQQAKIKELEGKVERARDVLGGMLLSYEQLFGLIYKTHISAHASPLNPPVTCSICKDLDTASKNVETAKFALKEIG